jgi:hypothetical protein
MAPTKKKSYQATADALLIVDRRQFTNGTVVPNFIADLWLPVIEYCGLGVLTILYRLGSFEATAGAPRINLKQLAKSGCMGYTRFRDILKQLEKLKFLKLHLPQGRARGQHERTVIELFDPPRDVPRSYSKKSRGRLSLKDVHGLSPVRWMIESEQRSEFLGRDSPGTHLETGEFLPRDSMEFPGRDSMEFLPRDSMPLFMETMCKEPMETTHTQAAPSDPKTIVCVSEFTRDERYEYARLNRDARGQYLGEGWVVDGRDGRYDESIRAWREQRRIAPCPDCYGGGIVMRFFQEEGRTVHCDHRHLPKAKPEPAASAVPPA